MLTSDANTGAAITAGIIEAMAFGASNFIESDAALIIERAAPSVNGEGMESGGKRRMIIKHNNIVIIDLIRLTVDKGCGRGHEGEEDSKDTRHD